MGAINNTLATTSFVHFLWDKCAVKQLYINKYAVKPARWMQVRPFKSDRMLRVEIRLKICTTAFPYRASNHLTEWPLRQLPHLQVVSRNQRPVGSPHTLSSLLRHFAVKNVIWERFYCRRCYSRPIEQLESIPEKQLLIYEPSFRAVGIDYFWQFLV